MQYIEVTSLEDACRVLSEYGERVKILAGGQALVILLEQKLIAPDYLLDIGRLHGLDYVRENGDGFSIGALTTHRTVETSASIRDKLPMLTEMEKAVGWVQIRNRGTVCGNLCHADAASDAATALLALGAKVKVISSRQERLIPLDDFFIGQLQTVLQPDEIMVEALVPKLAADSQGTYIKESIREGDTGIATVGTVITLDGETITQARIALGAVGPKPLRAKRAESLLIGRKANEDLDDVAEAAASECQLIADSKGLAEYKRHIVRIKTAQALAETIRRARRAS